MIALGPFQRLVVAAFWAASVGKPEQHAALVPWVLKRFPLVEWRAWGSVQPPEVVEGWLNEQWVGNRQPTRARASAWAIVPQSAGLVVVDVDDLCELPRVLRTYGRTPVVVMSPGRGVHLYYRHDGPAPVKSCADKRLGQYDIKAFGATVHAPPSLHERPGPGRPAIYTPIERAGDGWLDMMSGPRLELERWVARREGDGYLRDLMPPFDVDAYARERQRAGLHDRPQVGRPGVDDVELPETDRNVARWRGYVGATVRDDDGQRKVVQGERHNHLRGVALRLGDTGCPEYLALELLQDFNRHSIVPPFTEREVEYKVRDAYRTRDSALGCEPWDDMDED